jgi:hypothetical protein
MRSTLALTLLAVALVATGCKKSDKPAPGNGPTTPEAKPPEAKPPEAKPPEAKPPVGGDTLTLKETPAKVGDKRTKTDDVVVVFQFDAKGKKIDARSVEHKQEAAEILAVDGKIPMKVKVAYSGLKAEQTIGGKVQTKPQVLDGKTYVVWSEGGAIKATTADGAAVSAEELKELTSKNDELGKPDVIEDLLGGRTWKVGETYVLSADELAKVKANITDPSKPLPTEMSFTLKSFDDKQAMFEMTTTLVQAAKGADQLTFAMKGLAKVELPGVHASELSLDGTLAGSINSMPTTGTMTGKTTYTY